MLASYAVKKTRGREYLEKEDLFRTPFERDRHRIIHSKAFRRLAGKTQVFVATIGDHYRDRLSHTLEVAQVARDIARRLHLNEDLAEAIALAHDLGHPPFAHAGEEELDRIMRKFGFHFEHNEQSKRIVEVLEDRYPHFPGLNLTWEVREGLAKHQTHYDQKGKKISGKTLEAQVADLADEIAYHNHDLDDGFRSKLFTIEDLQKLTLWKKAEQAVEEEYGKVGRKYLRYLTINKLIAGMIQNVCETTSRRLERYRIRKLDDVLRFPKPLCGFSEAYQKAVSQLRHFLRKRMYQSKKVLHYSEEGKRIIRLLFETYLKNSRLLPKKLLEKAQKSRKKPIQGVTPLVIIIKDYIAGMTDAYAVKLHPKDRARSCRRSVATTHQATSHHLSLTTYKLSNEVSKMPT